MRGKLAPNAIYKKDLATYNDLTHNNALYSIYYRNDGSNPKRITSTQLSLI